MSAPLTKRLVPPPKERSVERNIGEAERQRRRPDVFQAADSFYRRTGTTPTRAENDTLARTDREELVRRNIQLVLYVVSNLLLIGPQRRRRGFNPAGIRIGFSRNDRGKADDLIQDGILGLIRAAETYDPDRGFTFPTYAMPWIIAAIQVGDSRQAVVHLPVAVARAVRVEPETLSADQRDSARRITSGFRNIDEPYGDEEEETLKDYLPSSEQDQPDEITARAALDALNPLERKVIEHRYGITGPPLDLQATGTRLGLTRREVREIERTAMRKMQAAT